MNATRLFSSVVVASVFAAALGVSQPEALGEAYVKALGGSASESLVSVVAYDEITYVSVGHTDSWGAGQADILLTMFDFRGNVLWAETVGEGGSDQPQCVIVTSDGNIVVTGWTTSSGEGGRDLFLAKFAPNGNRLWAATLGGDGDDEGFCVIETHDGDLAVVGDTNSVAATGWDVLLAKFDSDGNRLWVARGWSLRSDWGYRLVEMPGWNLLVTGGTAFGVPLDYDILLAKFDRDGHVVDEAWRIGEDDLWEWGRSLTRTADVGYALAGQAEDAFAGVSSFLLKRDSAVDPEWGVFVSSMGFPYNNYATSVIQASDGGLIVAGGYLNPDPDLFSTDVWLGKWNVGDGTTIWSRSFGGDDNDEASDVIENGCGCLVTVGYTASFGDDPPEALLARCICDGKTCLPDGGGPASRAWTAPEDRVSLYEEYLNWDDVNWFPDVAPVSPGITTVCEKCPGDINCDGRTAQSDLGILLSAWGKCTGDLGYDPCADLDRNGCVNQGDLGILLADWGCGTEP
jgi:hypothetical protein